MDKDKAIVILTAHLGLPFYNKEGNRVAANPDLSGTNVREAIFFALQELKGNSKNAVVDVPTNEVKVVKSNQGVPVFQPPVTFPPVVK